MTRSPSRAALLAGAFLALPVLSTPLLTTPAAAMVVYDPSNYAQNVLQAARALQQINNQITSLQNEAMMLVNQAKNLASLPHSSLQKLQQSVQQTQGLLAQAQRIAFNVGDIDRAFQSTYGAQGLTGTDRELVEGARERWKNSIAGLNDTMKVQAGVVGNIETSRAEAGELVQQSQNASGALQATQVGNQLLALIAFIDFLLCIILSDAIPAIL